MWFEVTTAPTANANVRMGVYAADSNLQPTGPPLFDSGDVPVLSATPVPNTNVKQSTPVTLQPGVYLSAFMTSTAMTIRTFLGGQTFVLPTGSNSPFTVLTYGTQTYGAFPTTGAQWITRAASTQGIRHLGLLRWRSP